MPAATKRSKKVAAAVEEPQRNSSYSDHQKELVKTIQQLSYGHSPWQVFSDFLEMSAISLSNSCDLGAQREKREERYLQLVKGYKPAEVEKFPEMFGMLVMALESGLSDVLGKTYHDLELHNKWIGQFFTPYVVCQMMAKMNIGDGADLQAKIEANGFIRAAEPSCGSAAMMIALAEAMKAAGINPQQHLHVTATDVDLKCVHMAYLQLSLLHIPAVIIHGNSLSLEEFDRWYTPAHIIGGWDWKLRRAASAAVEPEPAPEILVPETILIPAVLPAAAPMQYTLF